MENWKDGVDFAITVCDPEGIVTEMNGKSAAAFAKRGGAGLVGRSLLDCHSERSRDLIRRMLAENFSNSYTIEKNGVKKMIHQTPWLKDGKPAGLVEISFEIPFDLPHFVRKP